MSLSEVSKILSIKHADIEKVKSDLRLVCRAHNYHLNISSNGKETIPRYLVACSHAGTSPSKKTKKSDCKVSWMLKKNPEGLWTSINLSESDLVHNHEMDKLEVMTALFHYIHIYTYSFLLL